MATNAQKRARREVAHEQARRIRRRRTIVLVSAGVLIAAAIFVVIIVPAVARAGRVVVSVQSDAAVDAVRPAVTAAIDAHERLVVDDRSYRLAFDAQMSRPDATLMTAPTAVDAAPSAETSRLLAIDPYLLAVDRRSGLSVDSRAALETLLSTLADRALPADANAASAATPPLVVAGDVPLDFAAFLLYLAGEFLAPAEFTALLAAIADPDASVDTVAAQMRPVTDRVNAYRSSGILAQNWTDWDAGAVSDALSRGDGASFFVRRSAIKVLGSVQRSSVELYRVPAAFGRLTYRLVGTAVALEDSSAGAGRSRLDDRRLAAIGSVVSILRTDEVQLPIERDTPLSPVSLSGDAINATHRDVVRWFRSAAAYVTIDEATAEHPLFVELHRVLR